MKIYFGKLDAGTLDQFGSDDSFEHNGEYYYFELEYGTNPGGLEEITIRDTCGRYMPIPVDMLPVLQAVLDTIKIAHNTMHTADIVRDNVLDPKVAMGFGH